MKKFTIIMTVLIAMTIKINAQIPNSGFENWTVCMLPTTYNITQSNENSVMSQYKDSLVSGQIKIFFYKYFSPNGDGVMDLCGVQQIDSITSFMLSVWDLCSTKVFETNDPFISWEGTYQGNPLSKGIYKRSLSCTLTNGQTLSKTDSVQLILFDTIPVTNYMSPDFWSSDYLYTCTRDTSHYPSSVGNYSIRIDMDFVGAAFPIIGHPTSLTGYYKFAPQNGDTMNIVIALFKNGTQVTYDKFENQASTPNWTSFNIPISNYTDVDSGLILIAPFNIDAGPYGNSVLNIDNLNFDNLISSVPEQSVRNNLISIYPNPAYDFVTLNIDNSNNVDLTLNISVYNGLLC